MAMRHARRTLFVVCVFVALALQTAARPAFGDLKKWLIMPGPVIAAHADIEAECSACHSPVEKRPQGELCADCHTNVRDDLASNTGFHGRLPGAQRTACATCHTEHEGRDIDIVGLDAGTFDHAGTDFPLRGAHSEVPCTNCHVAGTAHRDAPSSCIACHRTDDVHSGNLGKDCAACHTPQRWTRTSFDHAATGFALIGAHQALPCSTCHADKHFAAPGSSCIACHRSDDVHHGQNGSQCADCHNVATWTKVAFNHEAVSGFALTGGHKALGCQACHKGGNDSAPAGHSCVACHKRDDPHAGRFGSACEGCHKSSGWRGVRFDHAAKTGFALPSGHDALACNACHTGHLEATLPRDCGTCHADDDPHKGQLGNACESCHQPDNWTAQLWFDHDIMHFPLLGAHATLSCDRCHATAAFHDADGACVSCHRADDPHHASLGESCESCHNPSDWRAWLFDHDRQTDFPLTGAHAGLSCNACHRDGTKPANAAGSDCIACHRRDDPHAGRFGDSCGNCHTTASFSRIEGL